MIFDESEIEGEEVDPSTIQYPNGKVTANKVANDCSSDDEEEEDEALLLSSSCPSSSNDNHELMFAIRCFLGFWISH